MPTPTLGYGQRGEAPIDAVNQWMRSQPWYTQLITSFGQNPNNVHLNDDQKQAVIRAAQANGITVDEGHNGQEIDDSGNFHAKSHKLRNTLIVAGIAGAALLTAGAAGAFAGAAAPAAGGAAAGGGAAAAGTGATVAGVEGLGWGVGDAALTGLGTGAMGATTAGVAGAGVAGAAGAASTAGGSAVEGASPWLADGTFAGDSTFGSVASGAGGSSFWMDLAKKYGPEAVSGFIKDYQANSRNDQRIKGEAALEETRLDPFRGYMAQARDVGKLDMQAEGNFASSPVQADAKYGAGLNVQPEQFYNPSPVMRAVARGARDQVAAGNTVPTLTDPANYGKMPVVHVPSDGSAASGPSSAPATAILAALRRKGLLGDDQPDNQTSPWLA